jgi:hypothetical protein
MNLRSGVVNPVTTSHRPAKQQNAIRLSEEAK